MHQVSLLAALHEDTGLLTAAATAWLRAATIAASIEDSVHRARYEARASFLLNRLGEVGRIPDTLARRSDRRLQALCRCPASNLQRRYDAAHAFFERHKLTQYLVHAHRVVADRLSTTGRASDRLTAAKMTVASIVAACPDLTSMSIAMEMHVQWLMKLPLSRAELQRLRNRVRNWLSELLESSSDPQVITVFLAGFNEVLKLGR